MDATRFVEAVNGLKHRLSKLHIKSDGLEISLPYDEFQTLRYALFDDPEVLRYALGNPHESTDRVMTVLGVKIIARVG